ncbi:Ig-like domain-containing protein [Leptothrix sp. BB-4]
MLALQPAFDTGKAGDLVTSLTRPAFDVRGEALTRVELKDAAGTLMGSVRLSPEGVGVLTVGQLADGTAVAGLTGGDAAAPAGRAYALLPIAYDAAGNNSRVNALADTINMRIDTYAPLRPQAALLASDDSGLSAVDGVTGKAVPSVRVTGEVDTRVTLFADANANGRFDGGELVYGSGTLVRPTGSGLANAPALGVGQGYLDVALASGAAPLPEGVLRLTAMLSDVADNRSPSIVLAPIQVMLPDASPPRLDLLAPPVGQAWDPVGEVIRVTATFGRAAYYAPAAGVPPGMVPSVRLNLSPTASVDAQLTSGLGTPVLTFSYVVRSGDNSAGVTLEPNAMSLNGGTLTDLAGNPLVITSAPVPAGAMPHRIDTIAPALVEQAYLSADSDSGVQNDGKTSDDTPTFTLVGEGGATVLLFDDPAATGRPDGRPVLGRVKLGDADGAASVRGQLTVGAALAPGDYTTLRVVQVDAAGNVSRAQTVKGAPDIGTLTISTAQPDVLTGLDFDPVMDARGLAGEGMAPVDHYTYISTPKFNFKGGTSGNTAILFMDKNKDGHYDLAAGDRFLGSAEISDTVRSVSVSAAEALGEGTYTDIRVIQASATNVMASQASSPAPALRIIPVTPDPVSIAFKEGQVSGSAATLSFTVRPATYADGARIVVFDDRNRNDVFDGNDVMLGQRGGTGDAIDYVDGGPEVVLKAPKPAPEGIYTRLMTYQIQGGRQSAASLVEGMPADGLTIDRTGPGLVIASDRFVLAPNTSSTLTFTFNEQPFGFDLARLVRTDLGGHATLSPLGPITQQLDGTIPVWRATATLSADGTGVSQFTLGATAGLFRDQYGNANPASLFRLEGMPDQTPPTIAISVDGRGAMDVRTLTFTASEAITGFTPDDISVYGGDAVGRLAKFAPVAGNPLQWTAEFTPAVSIVADTTIRVASSSVFDQNGNPGVGTTLPLRVDTAAAPVLTLPLPWTVADARLLVSEDMRLPLLATSVTSGATALTVGDADAADSASAIDRIVLTLNRDAVRGSGSLTVDAGRAGQVIGNNSAQLELYGTVRQLNDALASLSYLGAADFNGADTLVATVSDRSAKSQTVTLAIQVGAVNDAPVLQLGTSPGNGFVAGSAAPMTGITVIDVDSASVTVDLGVQHGRLSALAGASGAVVTATATTGGGSTLRLQGAPTAVQTALASLTYTGDGDYLALHPTFTTDTLTLLVTDAEGALTSGSLAVPVAPRPFAAPMLTLAAALQTGGLLVDEDTTSVPLGLDGVSVTDPDPAGSESALVRVDLTVAAGTLGATLAGKPVLSAATTPLAPADTGPGPQLLSLGGTVEVVNAALASLTYRDVLNAHGDRVVQMRAVDGSGLVSDAEFTVHVRSIGDAPVITLPVAPSDLILNVVHALPGVKAEDVDIGAGALASVTVSVAHGKLAVVAGAASGVELTGQGSGTLVLKGAQPALQAVLDSLTYTPNETVLQRSTADKGADVLTVSAGDGDATTADPVATLALSVLVPNRPVNGDIVVKGVTRVGELLAFVDRVTDQDGVLDGSRNYTWYRDQEAVTGPLSGTAARTYLTTAADLGHQVSVKLGLTDLRNVSSEVLSAPSELIESNTTLGLGNAIAFSNGTSAPAAQARLILSHQGSGFADYVLDVNGDGVIGLADKTAYIRNLVPNAQGVGLALAGGKFGALLTQSQWTVKAAIPADWQVPSDGSTGFWTATGGDLASPSHLQYAASHESISQDDRTSLAYQAFRVLA